MKGKFGSVGLKSIGEGAQSGWRTTFYFSESEEPTPISWVETFADFFRGLAPRNLIYFGAYVFEKGGRCFVLTYGKSHFYVRPYCDHDFGIEMAKRIANEDDIRMTASKKFAGKRKKEVKSYTNNTSLNIESGESVDYLRAAVAKPAREAFGTTGKFGSSLLVNAPVEKSQIGSLLDKITRSLRDDPLFALPRTARITDEAEVERYDQKLLGAIMEGADTAEFTHTGHDIVGVDFVFSGNERYSLSCQGHERRDLGDTELDLAALKAYIDNEVIQHGEVLNIRIKVDNEGQRPYSKLLKEALDFIVDGENVMLSQGHWLRFNEDYVEQLNTYVDGITVEPTETEFLVIHANEPTFNTSDAVRAVGYSVADRDFSKIRTRASTPIEAWDLQKGSTVYAVKFGTAQKAGYVCDQAIAVLEIIRNNANVRKLNKNWKSYCLWFGFELQNTYERISLCDSLILKQKIEAWARRCRELGIEPKIKQSLRRKIAT